jgi:hypothetical protein
MIIKTKSRKSGVKQLLTYLFKDETKLENEKDEKLVIRKNIRGRSVEKWVKEFEQNQSLRTTKRKDEVKAHHTVISFHDKDREHIDKALLKDIAKEYMKQKGEDIMYIATAHYDQDHVHIHIAESGAKYMSGVANRLSKEDFAKLKVAMATYQMEKYPQLVHSTPRHGRNENGYRKDERETQKNHLAALLENGFSLAKSEKDFISYLESTGHEPYYRNGVLTGIKYDGDRKYRFSKLGYGTEKMGELGTREQEEKELTALHDLRESASSKDRESTGRVMEEEHENEEPGLPT